jgi:outer membrane protein OmpA-like peptidoglycan-associated protein
MFFALCELESRDPNAIEQALCLRRELGHREDYTAAGTASYSIEQLCHWLKLATESGRVEIVEDIRVRVRPHVPIDTAILSWENEPPAEGDTTTTWFEAWVVDEVGNNVDGVELVFRIEGKQHRATTSGGKVRIDGISYEYGSVEFASVAKVQQKLYPIWEQEYGRREGEEPEGENVVRLVLTDDVPPVPVRAEQPLTLVLVPYAARLRLTGMHFDTSKSFVLPTAMQGIGKLRRIFTQHPHSTLYVIGHTDKQSDDTYNQKLSEERAAAVQAFVTDDVETWMGWYGSLVSWEKVWGTLEDRYMLSAVVDASGQPYYSASTTKTDAIRRFQEAHGCDRQDGTITADTRRKLITQYMRADRVEYGLDVDIRPERMETRGFGEQYPLPATEGGTAEQNARNRRVEMYLFGGFAPPIDDYPMWRDSYEEAYDFEDSGASGGGTSQISLCLVSNSASVKLANEPYRLHVEGATLEGTTDAEGCLEHKELPPGDYVLEVLGTSTVVPTQPTDEARCLHMVRGLDLFST